MDGYLVRPRLLANRGAAVRSGPEDAAFDAEMRPASAWGRRDTDSGFARRNAVPASSPWGYSAEAASARLSIDRGEPPWRWTMRGLAPAGHDGASGYLDPSSKNTTAKEGADEPDQGPTTR